MIGLLICLSILTSQCVCVHSKVIIVNSISGNDNTECCVNGECACSSLSTALHHIASHTIINITSQSVALNNTTTMGSGRLTYNITITGSNVTIMCNNSGSVYCKLCIGVMIKGITWDRCGDPNGINIAGVTFNIISNVSLINCTFQYSQTSAVSLAEVTDNILIHGCSFLSNIPTRTDDYYGILSITRHQSRIFNRRNITITIHEGYFYNNGYLQNNTDPNSMPLSPLHIDISKLKSFPKCNVALKKTTFISNRNTLFINIAILDLINLQLIEISSINNAAFGHGGKNINLVSHRSNIIFSIMSSNFAGNYGNNIWCFIKGNIKASVAINNSRFTDNKLTSNSSLLAVTVICAITIICEVKAEIAFNDMQFNNNMGNKMTDMNVVSIYTLIEDVKINFYMVNFTYNKDLGYDISPLHILLVGNNNSKTFLKKCKFVENQSLGHGAALYVYGESINDAIIQIEDTSFNQNIAGSSVVYITQSGFTYNNVKLLLNASTFANNTGSSMYLSSCDLKMSGTLLFKNNTAENGGAMYLTHGTTVTIEDETTVQFNDNTATVNGGAIYVDLLYCNFQTHMNTFLIMNHTDMTSLIVMFIKNSALIAGNSLYFSVPKFCSVNTNVSEFGSILYIPCQFNYSQLVNDKMTNIPCNLDYTLLNGTGAPIVTSPHDLRLYFPFGNGYNISSTSDGNVYFVRNNILGHPVKYTGAVFDYFGKPTEPVQFKVELHCLHDTICSSYILTGGNYDNIMTQSIDNFTILSVSIKGKEVDAKPMNLSVTLTSLSYLLKKITTKLIVELIPCIDRAGYTYSENSQMCVCYHINVKCSTDGNEIKKGHWFGSITSKATTSLCPNRYCDFTNRKRTSKGYFELPNTINAQCNDHRVGRACGECSSGYTLSYDSTDCISVDQCGTGWTVLVVTVTCLYWIAIVGGVFGLMYFKFQVSSGYLYGLVYYYSMVGTLLNNNPYISDDVFQFASVLSSFAQLTPQFLGKLCFVKGLSGIDQLFIHYSHAVAVSLLLLLIVVATRCSARISLFVGCCIIRVVCLLLLLSYTSIASTSLQLLLPLRFTDVKEWYTYSSPQIQYFHGRHIVYGVMAVICELVVGICLPLLLLLEPVLSKKINFIKIKPLLDQFQGCYKDKYRWFAAYYLICRQVIFLIVYTFSSNNHHMLAYLQTACVIMAMIHMWFQPYQNELLNALDGVILLLIILEANLNIFPFLKNVITEIAIIIVIIPLILSSAITIKNVINICLKKEQYRQCDPSDNRDNEIIQNIIIR